MAVGAALATSPQVTLGNAANADILRFRMYHENYGHCEDARDYYAAVPEERRVTVCNECGQCEPTCPNQLAIVAKLKEAHGLLA